MRFLLVIFFTFILNACETPKTSKEFVINDNFLTSKTTSHRRIESTKLFLQIPDGFFEENRLCFKNIKNRYHRIDILKTRNNNNIPEIKKNLEEQLQENINHRKNRNKVDKLVKSFKKDNWDIFYVEKPNNEHDYKVISLFLIKPNLCLEISVSFENNNLYLKNQAMDILSSVYYDEKLAEDIFEMNNYEINLSFSQFILVKQPESNYAKSLSDKKLKFFSMNGQFSEEKMFDEPFCFLEKIENINKKNETEFYTNNFLQNFIYAKGKTIKDRKREERQIERAGFIMNHFQITDNKKENYCFEAFMVNYIGETFHFVGMCDKKDAQKYKDIFYQTIKSLQPLIKD